MKTLVIIVSIILIILFLYGVVYSIRGLFKVLMFKRKIKTKRHKRRRVKTNDYFERTFNKLYGDTWVVVKCGGMCKLQVQRDVVKAVQALEKGSCCKGEYEIEISRSASETKREEVY